MNTEEQRISKLAKFAIIGFIIVQLLLALFQTFIAPNDPDRKSGLYKYQSGSFFKNSNPDGNPFPESENTASILETSLKTFGYLSLAFFSGYYSFGWVELFTMGLFILEPFLGNFSILRKKPLLSSIEKYLPTDNQAKGLMLLIGALPILVYFLQAKVVASYSTEEPAFQSLISYSISFILIPVKAIYWWGFLTVICPMDLFIRQPNINILKYLPIFLFLTCVYFFYLEHLLGTVQLLFGLEFLNSLGEVRAFAAYIGAVLPTLLLFYLFSTNKVFGSLDKFRLQVSSLVTSIVLGCLFPFLYFVGFLQNPDLAQTLTSFAIVGSWLFWIYRWRKATA
ncbi:hypothetical protein [Leptospira sarikeiensis]|uniref:Uncharacterized protein n=1 Tax=Leptospira sarikeiensis TaxID=2484943 RepID=A0A4R9K7Y0_9LEPT|nr:hypothetical protein [Leptospira sarikeiensis]TGL61556.1 hypothetical protein EHQ64_09295 [Leptospira sarikeiensis]